MTTLLMMALSITIGVVIYKSVIEERKTRDASVKKFGAE